MIVNAYGVPFQALSLAGAPAVELMLSCTWYSRSWGCGLPRDYHHNDKTITAIANMNGIISPPEGHGPGDDIAKMMAAGANRGCVGNGYQTLLLSRVQRSRSFVIFIRERCLIHKPEGAIFCGCGFKICRLPPSYSIALESARRADCQAPAAFPGLDRSGRTHQCMRMNCDA